MIRIKKRPRSRSVQELFGIQGFTKYGLLTGNGELLFYQVAPTNISVLSEAHIADKIRNLMMVLSAIPDLEILCTDAAECFDANKAHLLSRLAEERNPNVRSVIQKDIAFLDRIQTEMATARQFFFAARRKEGKDKQMLDTVNRIEKRIAEQGFEVRRMKPPELKRFLALYFDATPTGDALPDFDGAQYFRESVDNCPENRV